MRVWQKTVYIGLPAALAVSFVGFYSWANQSVSVKPQVKSAQASIQGAPHTTTVNGKRYQMTIDGDYKIREQQTEPQGVILENFVATQTTRGSGKLAVTVAKLPNGGLKEVPDIMFRKQSSDRYQQVILENMPDGAMAFRATNGYEADVTWQHGDLYVSVVLSNSIGTNDSYDSELSSILASWAWID